MNERVGKISYNNIKSQITFTSTSLLPYSIYVVYWENFNKNLPTCWTEYKNKLVT